jgi:hypothetical protein
MGNEISDYQMTNSHHSYIARVAPRADLRPGDKEQMALNAEKVHIFDRATEKNIATPH